MSAGSIEQEPSRKLACCGVPLITEDMQSLAIRTLSGTDINKHYDLIRELGKGTYGKVDLVSHKSTGEGSGVGSEQGEAPVRGRAWERGGWARSAAAGHAPCSASPLPAAGTKMALKFVNKSKTKLKNFLREFSITNTLSSSPFIIKVFDVVFETEDCYVFAQEYAPGGDLFDIIPPQVGAAAGCWGGGHEGSVSSGCWAKPPTRLALHQGARWGSRCLWSCLEPDVGTRHIHLGQSHWQQCQHEVVQHLKAGALCPSPGCPGTHHQTHRPSPGWPGSHK